MKLTAWVNSKIKKLDWTDIKLIKLSVAAFVLMLAKLWPTILALDWYWYLLISVAAAIRPYGKVFRKS